MDWSDWVLQKNAEFTLDKLGLSKEDYALAKSDEFWNNAYKTLSTLHNTKPKSLDQVKAWDTGLSKLMDIWKRKDMGAWNTAMGQLRAGQAARKTGQPNVVPNPVNKAPGSY